MEYYCLMVRTGAESDFKERATKALADEGMDATLHFFQRRLRKGKDEYYDAALFPGYLFLQVESLTVEVVGLLRRVKDFYRLLPATGQPQEIRGAALDELKLFMGHGGYLGISRVAFLPGKRIRAISGPMVGLEGNVYKVNKKKRQITVISSLSPDGKKFDLLYEDAELLEE
ncbi:MAG: hypothetical protein J6C11_04770 [Spirochaetaceae bacterium]|nr:hypothetical protein [Spirochaetaceae bacterium]MBQ8385719.1 hypothetical protein [Spirochaetaceae bacterium]